MASVDRFILTALGAEEDAIVFVDYSVAIETVVCCAVFSIFPVGSMFQMLDRRLVKKNKHGS